MPTGTPSISVGIAMSATPPRGPPTRPAPMFKREAPPPKGARPQSGSPGRDPSLVLAHGSYDARPRSGSDHVPAVDGDPLAGDEPTRVGGQVRHHRRDVGRRAQPPQRHLGG